MQKKSSLPVALSMLVVFLSGSVVGALAHRLYMVKSVGAVRDLRPPSPQEYKNRYISELKSRLALNEAQVSKVAAVLDHTNSRFRELHERTRPERSKIHETQVEEIRSILSSEQLPKYEQYLKDRERRRKEAQKASGR
jgi:hypothetical protein